MQANLNEMMGPSQEVNAEELFKQQLADKFKQASFFWYDLNINILFNFLSYVIILQVSYLNF